MVFPEYASTPFKTKLLTSAFLCGVFACPSVALSATWTGTTNTNWAQGTNWNTGTAPTNTVDATINSSTNSPTITTAGAQSLNTIIGSTTTSSLTLSNAGTLATANNAQIGDGSTATGTVLSTGTGTTWTISNQLNIGKRGTGTLTISNGATINDNISNIASETGSTGSVLLTGSGSKWTHAITLRVGDYGRGNLLVSNGGVINSQIGRIADNGTDSIGIATIDGIGSKWIMTASNIIALRGNGTLNITNGGYMSNSTAIIASYGTATAAVNISGTGSQWINSLDLTIGRLGTGTLTITDGGLVQNTWGSIAGAAGKSSSVRVAGTNSRWINSGEVSVGSYGQGTLTIESGARVESGNARIGYYGGSNGTTLVTGPNSIWASTGSMFLGFQQNASGTLTIENGATVTNTLSGSVGYALNSTATATVTGPNSSWINGSELSIGSLGTGTLNVASGGHIESASARIGYSNQSKGTVNLTDSGSNWQANGSMYLGFQSGSTGTLNLFNGATVTNTLEGSIGYALNSTATAKVTGANSKWTNNAELNIGKNGTGTLIVSDQANVTAATQINIAKLAGSTGSLFIGAEENHPATEAGTLTTPLINFGLGTGKLIFNHTNSNYILNSTISGNGIIYADSGKTTLTGNLTNFTGTTFIRNTSTLNIANTFSGNISIDNNSTLNATAPIQGNITVGENATLNANSTIGGNVLINAGGQLKGSGTIIQNTTIATGGRIAPGNSIGTLNITGDISFAPSSFYDVEVNTSGQSDKIEATGTATLTGGTVNLIPEDSGLYKLGTYTILSAAGGVTGRFDTLTTSIDSLFSHPELTYDSHNIFVNISRNATSFASVATTENERATANALEFLAPDSTLYKELTAQTTQQGARNIFQATNGELHTNIKSSLLESNLALPQNIQPPTAKQNTILWMQHTQERRDRNNTTNTKAFTTQETNTIWGAQTAPENNTYLGLWGSYGQNDYTLQPTPTNAATGTADTYRLALYRGLTTENWNLRATSLYSYHAIETDRIINLQTYTTHPRATYNAHSLVGTIQAAYTFTPSKQTAWGPYSDVTYGLVHLSHIKEKDSEAALSTQNDLTTQGTTTLGLRLQQSFATSTTSSPAFTTQLGWKHVLGNENPKKSFRLNTSPTFETSGAPTARDLFALETGFTLPLSAPLALDFKYKGLFSPQSTSNALYGTLLWKL